jgi:hypothetical protein
VSRLSPREMIEALDALSRVQALSPAQSSALERALAKARAGDGARPPQRRRWTPAELDVVRAAMKPNARRGRPKIGEEFVPQLARVLDRTPEAVVQCMKRLREENRNGPRCRADGDQYRLELSEGRGTASSPHAPFPAPHLRRLMEGMAA